MYKISILLFAFFTSLIASENTYVFKAKGEFAKELKTLMEKYSKEGKVEIQEVNNDDIRESKTVISMDLFLNNEKIMGDIAYGKELYNKKCASCHGENANMSSYSNARILSTLSKKEIVEQLEKYSTDPTYGGSTKFIMNQAVVDIRTNDIISIASYIYSLKHSDKNLASDVKSYQNESKEESSSYLK